MQQLLFLVPKKGKEFSQNHGESCNTQTRATNVNKLGDIYIRSIILNELVVLRENQWSKTFYMLFFFICTRTKHVYSINGPKFGLEVKQLLFPLFRPNTILVKNLETLACVFPFPMLIWVLQQFQCFKIHVAQHWRGRGHITVRTKV